MSLSVSGSGSVSVQPIICLCICIQIEGRMWAWFTQEVTLNQANVVMSNRIFIGYAIVVPSKHQVNLILAHN